MRALIVLAAFGVAQQQITRNERIFRDAIATKNTAIVDAFLTRFNIQKEKLSESATYDLAIAQINAEKVKVLFRYALIFLAVTGFFLLVFSLISPPARSTPDDSSAKFTLALIQVEDVNIRIDLYRKYCSCKPPQEIIDGLRKTRYSNETLSNPPISPSPVLAALKSANSRAEMDKVLADVDISACDGNFEFAVRAARLICKDGRSIPFLITPAKGQKLISLQAVVFHFTGANAFKGTINWFTQSEARSSVHLLISRTGAVVQFASFDERTWHAGASRWTSPDGTSFVGLNSYSIGISYDNLGEVHKTDKGQFASSDGQVINPRDVECFGESSSENCWQSYTSAQLNVTKGLIGALFAAYGRLPLLGHSEISPGRKTDPGPAFPIEKLRKQFGLVGSTT